MASKFFHHLEEAIGNIQKDRTVASELLQDVSEYIGENKERHKDVGQVAAKYLETLQRSNEQLVKLTSMLQKMEDLDYGDLSGDDKDKLFDSFDAIGEDD
jgi:F0F1-type ATP synthase membrane subunit b/b'